MKLKKKLVLTKVGSQHMVVPMEKETEEQGEIWLLNETAYRIWQGMADGHSNDEIVSDLTNHYAVTEEDARAALRRLQARLLELDLVEDV